MRRRAFVSNGLGLIGSTCITSLIAGTAAAQNAPANNAPLEEVVVTGLRASLQSSTDAKRESTGFVDSIFAEDIGKFPDSNIAESFNRIPGVMINRELTGEGLNVAIRGLNTNFTRVLINNAPVAIASTGQDSGSTNREVDLDLFPTELFSQLTVAKTPSASLIEGGAAGTINMRMSRPFDRQGRRLTYSVQGIDNGYADGTGAKGSLIASDTWDKFGILAGVTGIHNKVATKGFETVGWTSQALTQDQCGFGANNAPNPCNTTGGAGAGPGQLFSVPDNPSTRAAGLNPGDPITQAFLLSHNPGATIQQIDNGLIPRLGRPMFDVGEKNRYNAIVSMEFRPTDDLQFFVDSMYGKKENNLERVDMMWGVRRTSNGGFVIPTNMTFDKSDCSAGCTVTSGVFPNSVFLLEYRPYTENVEFWGTNPGMNWQFTDKLKLNVEGNYTKSRFHREDPTVLAVSAPSTVTYTDDGTTPSIVSSVDINNPANFGWLNTNRGGAVAGRIDPDIGRVDMVDERRETDTKGGRLSLTWGDSALSLSAGGAYDVVSRDIRPLANSQLWQNVVCGGSPGVNVLAPNTQPSCRGETAAQITPGANGYPTYTTYSGSLIPNASLANFLHPTKYGFVSVDWDSFKQASNYDAIHDGLLDTGATPTTASWGSIEEDITGFFTQVDGDTTIGENRLRYNAGVRWVKTKQSVTSRLTRPDLRNTTQADGTRFPDEQSFVPLDRDYSNVLPSANVAWNVTDDFIVRAGASRTMTRANPADMLLGLAIRNADVSQVNLGNPNLDPYKSGNLDLGFEYYTGQEGYFGVAAFRKNLEGFTTQRTTTVLFRDLAQFGVTLDSLGASQQTAILNRGGLDAPVQLSQVINASGRLTINGLEFNWVQPLDILLGKIGVEGFGLSANYTIIDQKGSGAAPAIAIGVPPKSYNAMLYYDKHGVSARISITAGQGSQGSGPNSNQQQVNGAELFGNSFKQWDFSSSYDFTTLFGWSDVVPKLTIDVVNITQEKRRTYFQFPNAAFNEFDSGRQIIVGLRGSF